MLSFKVTTVGASSGVILTKEAMARLKVKKGDTLYLTEAPDGGYRLTPYDPDFARQMALAEEIMHDDREVLRAAGEVSQDDLSHWRWVGLSVVLAIHDRQLAEHGGLDGIRDLKMIESALARPLNLASYGNPDAADLAAAYAYGLANNHGFVDGNKRTAWVTARLFLADNGQRPDFDPMDAIRVMEDVAGGRIREAGLADWFRRGLKT